MALLAIVLSIYRNSPPLLRLDEWSEGYVMIFGCLSGHPPFVVAIGTYLVSSVPSMVSTYSILPLFACTLPAKVDRQFVLPWCLPSIGLASSCKVCSPMLSEELVF